MKLLFAIPFIFCLGLAVPTTAFAPSPPQQHYRMAPLSAADPAVVSGLASIAIAATAYYLNSPEISNDIRTFWEETVKLDDDNETTPKKATKVLEPLEIPKLTKDTSQKQLTLMIKDVADSVEQRNRDLEDNKKVREQQAKESTPTDDRSTPLKVSRVYSGPVSAAITTPATSFFAPKKKKRPFVVRALKKVVMPWKKWTDL